MKPFFDLRLRNVSKQFLRKSTYCPAAKWRTIKWALIWYFFDKFLLFRVFSLSQKPVSNNHMNFTRTAFCFLSFGNFDRLSIFVLVHVFMSRFPFLYRKQEAAILEISAKLVSVYATVPQTIRFTYWFYFHRFVKCNYCSSKLPNIRNLLW